MKNKNLIVLIIVIATAVLGYMALTKPDPRTDGQRVGDAIDALQEGKGLDEAAKQLEERTAGEKLGDAIKDATDEK